MLISFTGWAYNLKNVLQLWFDGLSSHAGLSYLTKNSEISSASHWLGKWGLISDPTAFIWERKLFSAATPWRREERINCPRAGKRFLLKAKSHCLFTVEDIIKSEFPLLKIRNDCSFIFNALSRWEIPTNLYRRQEINYAEEIKDKRADPRYFTLGLAIMIKDEDGLCFVSLMRKMFELGFTMF